MVGETVLAPVMAQRYSYPQNYESNSVGSKVGGDGTTDRLCGKPAWLSGEDLQGITGLPQSMRPGTTFEQARAGSGLSPTQLSPLYPNLEGSSGSSLEFQLPAPAISALNQYAPQFRGIKTTNFHPETATGTDQEAWTSLRVTGVGANAVEPPPRVKRARIRGPGGDPMENSQEILSDVGSQISGHLPSDSGYATKSIATRSEFGSYPMDRCFTAGSTQNTRPTAHAFSSQSFADYASNNAAQEETWRLDAESISSAVNQQVVCDVPNCNWRGKCPSDKTKHMIRHEKRFRCQERGCNRKEGFGTVNDLERHKKCVHGIQPKHGTTKRYKCFADNCPRKNQIWPRNDNFRQHLLRVHGEKEFERLLRLSDQWYESMGYRSANQVEGAESYGPSGVVSQTSASKLNDTVSLPDLGGHLDPSRDLQLNEGLHPVSAYSSVTAPASDYPTGNSFGRQNQTNEDFRTSSASVPSDSVRKPSELERSTTRLEFRDEFPAHGNSNRHHQFDELEGLNTSSSITHGTTTNHASSPPNLSLADAASGLLKALEKQIEVIRRRQQRQNLQNGVVSQTPGTAGASAPSFLDLLNDTGRRENKKELLQKLLVATLDQLKGPETPPGSTTQEPSKSSVNNDSPDVEGLVFKCPHVHCKRETRRLCDLKKHLKRHERPYGCTFTNCKKRFGSKNDWKRHENAQHFQLQSWLCQENAVEDVDETDRLRTRECGRHFYRRELFVNHLRADHGKTNSDIKVSLRTNKLGRNGQFQFWCGFCRKIISLSNQGVDAWDERFDHIDEEHYKKGENISNWRPPDKDCAEETSSKDDASLSTDGSQRDADYDTRSEIHHKENESSDNTSSLPTNTTEEPQKSNQAINPLDSEPACDQTATSSNPSREPFINASLLEPNPPAQRMFVPSFTPTNPSGAGQYLSYPAGAGAGRSVSTMQHNRATAEALANQLISISPIETPVPTMVTCCNCVRHTYLLAHQDGCTICQHRPCNQCTYGYNEVG